MSKRTAKSSPKEKLHRWRISRIKTPAVQLGSVTAPDEKTALQRAAEEFQVRPELRDRLVARRADGVGAAEQPPRPVPRALRASRLT